MSEEKRTVDRIVEMVKKIRTVKKVK